MKRTICLLTLIFSTASAQIITLNALKKMEGPFNFVEQNIIMRIMATQKESIEKGVLTEFESRCIASNIVEMFGAQNAARFVSITERTKNAPDTISLDDKTFINEIEKRYLIYLQIVTDECALGNKKESK